MKDSTKFGLNCYMLNKVPRDTSYDGLNHDSTEIEKLDVVFNVLKKESSPTYLFHSKLHIPHGQEATFEAILIDTGFVDYQDGGSSYTFKLNTAGLLMMKNHGSFSNYLQHQAFERIQSLNDNQKRKELQDEIDRLTLFSLRTANENKDLVKQLQEAQLKLAELQAKDTPINAVDRKTLIFWQILAGVLAAITFILLFIKL